MRRNSSALMLLSLENSMFTHLQSDDKSGEAFPLPALFTRQKWVQRSPYLYLTILRGYPFHVCGALVKTRNRVGNQRRIPAKGKREIHIALIGPQNVHLLLSLWNLKA